MGYPAEHRRISHYSLWFILAAIGLEIGCNASDSRLAPVQGIVIYNGKPVSAAEVRFIGSNASRFAVGETDEQGHFSLTTYQPGDGAFIGKHRVTIIKMASSSAASTKSYEDIDAAMEAEAQRQSISKSALPARYADPKTSDQELEVLPGENDFTITLED